MNFSNLPPFLGEALAQRLANPARTASDHDDLVSKLHGMTPYQRSRALARAIMGPGASVDGVRADLGRDRSARHGQRHREERATERRAPHRDRASMLDHNLSRDSQA